MMPNTDNQKDEQEFLHEKHHLLVEQGKAQLFAQDIADSSKHLQQQKRTSRSWFLIGLFGTLLFFFITVLFTFAFAYLFYSSVSDRTPVPVLRNK